jgi:hypothetical protein
MATLGGSFPTGLPCHRTSPDEGVERPVNIRKNVDFPEPEGPRRQMIFPADTSKSVGAMTSMRLPSGWV